MLFSRMPAGETRPPRREFVLVIPISRHRRFPRFHAVLKRSLWRLDEFRYRIRLHSGDVPIGTWML